MSCPDLVLTRPRLRWHSGREVHPGRTSAGLVRTAYAAVVLCGTGRDGQESLPGTGTPVSVPVPVLALRCTPLCLRTIMHAEW